MTDIIEQPVAVRGTTKDKAPEPTLSDTAIRGDRYWSPEFARREEEALWPRVWQVAGRVDQIPEPGDYVTYEIGRDSIIAVRGMDGVVRAFYNVCQHRGNRLVTAEVGSLLAGEFQCAYHGWRFGADGRLNWVPDEDDFPQGSPCGVRNLVEMPSRHLGRVHLVQHGSRRRTAARVARPGGRPPRRLPHGGHEAHALGDGRGRLQLEVRPGQLQRELPPALRAPADARVDERAPQRLPVRPVPVRPRPDADARRRARSAVPGQAGADDQEPRTRPRVLGTRPRAVPRRPAVAAHRAAAPQA